MYVCLCVGPRRNSRQGRRIVEIYASMDSSGPGGVPKLYGVTVQTISAVRKRNTCPKLTVEASDVVLRSRMDTRGSVGVPIRFSVKTLSAVSAVRNYNMCPELTVEAVDVAVRPRVDG